MYFHTDEISDNVIQADVEKLKLWFLSCAQSKPDVTTQEAKFIVTEISKGLFESALELLSIDLSKQI